MQIAHYRFKVWKINKNGRTYKNGQSVSADFRMPLIDSIVQRGGNRFTGKVLYGSYTFVASSLKIQSKQL